MFLAFLLGWFLRKIFGGEPDCDCDCCEKLEDLKSRYATLENKLQQLDLSKEKVMTSSPAATNSLGAVAKTGNPYTRLKNNNLQIIEGIGPKMEEVLKKHGVRTWTDLAGKKASELRILLDKENPKSYKIIDPSTWPDQAKLAVNGEWEALISMQKNLDTGRTNTTGNTDSKLENIMIKLGLIKRWKKDDLKAIDGIGPKIASLLNEAGIKTWKQLANTPLDTLKKILADAGPRFKLADPTTWSKQAQLADEEKWDELQEYQEFLAGGK